MRIFAVDRESLLVHVDARATLREVEETLARDGLTLDVENARARDDAIGAWLDRGAPGARSAWLDPADHLVAGFSSRAHARGDLLVIKPAPRRAVGPDLLALLLGQEGRFLRLESVWLRVHRVGVARPSVAFAGDESQAPLNDDELRLIAMLERHRDA